MFIEPSASTTIARLTNPRVTAMIAATAVATQLSTIIQYNTIQYNVATQHCYTVKYCNTIQHNTMYNGGQKGEGGYAESRWTLIVSDFTVLRTAGSSFHH